jgi:2,3-bisphosphoglycerate-independent phosphoglycerate mutase
MVGHTANVPAIIEALEETDKELGRVVDALVAKGGSAFITSDHGNCEVNIDSITGKKHTSHTCNPVPAIFTDSSYEIVSGGLKDIAPTILSLYGIKIPESMTGTPLLKEIK